MATGSRKSLPAVSSSPSKRGLPRRASSDAIGLRRGSPEQGANGAAQRHPAVKGSAPDSAGSPGSKRPSVTERLKPALKESQQAQANGPGPVGGRKLSRELRSAISLIQECGFDENSGRLVLRDSSLPTSTLGSCSSSTSVECAGSPGQSAVTSSEAESSVSGLSHECGSTAVFEQEVIAPPSTATPSPHESVSRKLHMETVDEQEEETKEEVLLQESDAPPAMSHIEVSASTIVESQFEASSFEEAERAWKASMVQPIATESRYGAAEASGSSRTPRSVASSAAGASAGTSKAAEPKARVTNSSSQKSFTATRQQSDARRPRLAGTSSSTATVPSARKPNGSTAPRVTSARNFAGRGEDANHVATARSTATSAAPSGASTPQAALEPRSTSRRARSVEPMGPVSSRGKRGALNRSEVLQQPASHEPTVESCAAAASSSTSVPGRQIVALAMDAVHVVAGYDALGQTQDGQRSTTQSALPESRCQVWPVARDPALRAAAERNMDGMPSGFSLVVRGVHRGVVTALALEHGSPSGASWLVSASADRAVAWRLDELWKMARRQSTLVPGQHTFEGVALQVDSSPLMPLDSWPGARSSAMLFTASPNRLDPSSGEAISAVAVKQVEACGEELGLQVALLMGSKLCLYQVTLDRQVFSTTSLDMTSPLRCFVFASTRLEEAPEEAIRLLVGDSAPSLRVWTDLRLTSHSALQSEPRSVQLLPAVAIHCLAVSASSCDRCYVGGDFAIVQIIDVKQARLAFDDSSPSSAPMRVRLSGEDAPIIGLHSLARASATGDTLVALLADGGICMQDVLILSGEAILDGSASRCFSVNSVSSNGMLKGMLSGTTGEADQRVRLAWSEPGMSTVRVALLPTSKDAVDGGIPAATKRQGALTISRTVALKTIASTESLSALRPGPNGARRVSVGSSCSTAAAPDRDLSHKRYASQPPSQGLRQAKSSPSVAPPSSRKASPSRSPRRATFTPSASSSAQRPPSTTPRSPEGVVQPSARGKDPAQWSRSRQESTKSTSKAPVGRRAAPVSQQQQPSQRQEMRPRAGRQRRGSENEEAEPCDAAPEEVPSLQEDEPVRGNPWPSAEAHSFVLSAPALDPAVGRIAARAVLDPSWRPQHAPWETPRISACEAASGTNTPQRITSPASTSRPFGSAVGMFTARSPGAAGTPAGPVLFAAPQLTFRTTGCVSCNAPHAPVRTAAQSQGVAFQSMSASSSTTSMPSSAAYFPRAPAGAVLFAANV